MACQEDDSFVCFGAKPDKGFWTWDLAMTGSGRGREKRVSWEKELEGAVGEGRRTREVDTGHRSGETSRQEIGSRPVKED